MITGNLHMLIVGTDEGNAAVIKEGVAFFDRVFAGLEKEKQKLVVGDRTLEELEKDV